VLPDGFDAFIGFGGFPFPCCPRTLRHRRGRGCGTEPSPPRGAAEQHPIPAATGVGSRQLLAPEFSFTKREKQDFCSENIIPRLSICICTFNLHFNFYQYLRVSISIWIHVFLRVLYIHDSVLLPGSQTGARNDFLPNHLVSNTRALQLSCLAM